MILVFRLTDENHKQKQMLKFFLLFFKIIKKKFLIN